MTASSTHQPATKDDDQEIQMNVEEDEPSESSLPAPHDTPEAATVPSVSPLAPSDEADECSESRSPTIEISGQSTSAPEEEEGEGAKEEVDDDNHIPPTPLKISEVLESSSSKIPSVDNNQEKTATWSLNENPTSNENTPTPPEENSTADKAPKKSEPSNNSKASTRAPLSANSKIVQASDLSNTSRKIWIVTTAALPWRTGTSVNPLARALELTKGRAHKAVTLVLPFLESEEQQRMVYPDRILFSSHDEQAEWIRNYAIERVQCSDTQVDALNIIFYQATYHKLFGSIFPIEDICALLDNDYNDVAILEEPEHLNWFRPLPTAEQEAEDPSAVLGWSAQFSHVVGILHTNYSAYMKQYGMGTSFLAEAAIRSLSSIVVRGYCHKVVRLSDTLLPPLVPWEFKEVTCNVHGVRSEFLEPPPSTKDRDNRKASEIYFIGKLIWAKGLDHFLRVQEAYKNKIGYYFPVDLYGGGPDEEAIHRACFGRKGIVQEEPDPPLPPLSTQDEAAMSIFQRGSLRECVSDTSSLPKSFDAKYKSINSDAANPLDIVGASFNHVVGTSVQTTQAVGKVAQQLVQLGFRLTFSEEIVADTQGASDKENEGQETTTNIKFDPPQSRFEIRTQALPVRFMGVQDHALLRRKPNSKIFLNMSTTEVLCTTTAEALAMGKFVILPRHRKLILFSTDP